MFKFSLSGQSLVMMHKKSLVLVLFIYDELVLLFLEENWLAFHNLFILFFFFPLWFCCFSSFDIPPLCCSPSVCLHVSHVFAFVSTATADTHSNPLNLSLPPHNITSACTKRSSAANTLHPNHTTPLAVKSLLNDIGACEVLEQRFHSHVRVHTVS